MRDSKSQIAAGGGYSVHTFTGRPRFRLYCFIALLWLPVTLLASIALVAGLSEESVKSRWLCWLLVVVEPVLLALALFFRFTEQPRKVIEHHVP